MTFHANTAADAEELSRDSAIGAAIVGNISNLAPHVLAAGHANANTSVTYLIDKVK